MAITGWIHLLVQPIRYSSQSCTLTRNWMAVVTGLLWDEHYNPPTGGNKVMSRFRSTSRWGKVQRLAGMHHVSIHKLFHCNSMQGSGWRHRVTLMKVIHGLGILGVFYYDHPLQGAPLSGTRLFSIHLQYTTYRLHPIHEWVPFLKKKFINKIFENRAILSQVLYSHYIWQDSFLWIKIMSNFALIGVALSH